MEYIFYFRNLFLILPLFGLYNCKDKIPEERVSGFGSQPVWPEYQNFGQISAVGVDSYGNIYVFHRGDRRWGYNSFSLSNVFAEKIKGPILNETIAVLEPNKGSLLKKSGNNFFYLPHGLTVDHENHIWVTDVAMHQVFKFPPINLYNKSFRHLGEPILTLGVAFVPGNDDNHFCKPTDVAVDKESNEFYVSDGYCNSRIIKYDKYGKKLLHWGKKTIGIPQNYFLNVPHALALAQDKKLLFVADRENFRALAYDTEHGRYKGTFAQNLEIRIFSVAYSPEEGGLLFSLSNSTMFPNKVSVSNLKTKKIVLDFAPEGYFTTPHDLTISPDGQYCYVVELDPHKLWRFKIDVNKTFQILDPFEELPEKTSTKPNERLEVPVLAESKIIKTKNENVGSSFLAVGLVSSIVIISFLIFMFHYYRGRGEYRSYESRRLFSDDDEDGIRLT